MLRSLLFTVLLSSLLSPNIAPAGWGIMGIELFGKSCQLNEYEDIPGEPEALYEQALQHTKAEEHCEAARLHLAIIRQFPWKALSVESKFLVIDALYLADKWDRSITASKMYLRDYGHKMDERVEYAAYMIGEAFFRYIPEDIRFDTTDAYKAQRAFAEFIANFPKSKWAPEAKRKLQISYNILAKKEISLGNYYLERKDYYRAAVRYQVVPKDFRSSEHVPEALYLLVDCFLGLKKVPEALAAKKILETRFKDSPFTEKVPAIFAKWGVDPNQTPTKELEIWE